MKQNCIKSSTELKTTPNQLTQWSTDEKQRPICTLHPHPPVSAPLCDADVFWHKSRLFDLPQKSCSLLASNPPSPTLSLSPSFSLCQLEVSRLLRRKKLLPVYSGRQSGELLAIQAAKLITSTAAFCESWAPPLILWRMWFGVASGTRSITNKTGLVH